MSSCQGNQAPSGKPWTPIKLPGPTMATLRCPMASATPLLSYGRHLPSAMEQSAPTVDPSFHKIVYEEMSSHTHSSMFYTACQTFYLLIEHCPPFNADFFHSSLHRVLPKLPFPFLEAEQLGSSLTDGQEPASRPARLGH